MKGKNSKVLEEVFNFFKILKNFVLQRICYKKTIGFIADQLNI